MSYENLIKNFETLCLGLNNLVDCLEQNIKLAQQI